MGSACRSCLIVAWPDVYNQYSVLYVPTVGYCVCCDISARLLRPNYLYAFCYMGLFFNMLDLTSLIPLSSVSIAQAVCLQIVRGGKVTILGGHSIGHSKQNPYVYTCQIANGF